MSNNRGTSVWFIIIIISAVLATGYFIYRNQLHKGIPGIKAIPESTVFFIEIKNPSAFAELILHENQMWDKLLEIPGLPGIQSDIHLIDSLLDNKNLPTETEQNFYISFHQQNDSLPVLFVLESGGKGNSLINQLSEISGSGIRYVAEQKIESDIIHKYAYGKNKKTFFTSQRNGLLLISDSKSLLLESIEQINSNKHFTSDPVFTKVAETAGKKVDAHIYLHAAKTGYLAGIAGNEIVNRNDSLLLNNFADWSELDVILKKNELLLNGYTRGSDSLRRYLNIFTGQKSPRILMPQILPYNTSLLLHFGIEDFSAYYSSFEDYLKTTGEYEKYYQQAAAFNNQYNLNIEEQFLSWIGNEMALISTAENMDEYPENSYIVFHAKDPVKANQLLTGALHNVPGSAKIKTYRDHLIKKINLPYVYQTLFGDIYGFLESPYYTIVDDYVVFANSSNSLEEFIRSNAAGKTLDANVNYQAFSDNISDRSNLLLYINTRNALDLLKGYVNTELQGIFEENIHVLRNFHAFALQFSSLRDMFYTNAYLKYNSEYVEENRAAWKVELDAPVIGKPYLVKDHTDKTYNVIVFDEENKMYLIDNKGNTLWKTTYAGELLSEVYPVDYYKNRKIQYLFNTDEYLYLIDLLGRSVANYPIKLNISPTNGITVLDYINDKNYRILFAGEDNKIHNYNLKGNPVRGWKEPKVQSEVNNPVQHLVSGNRDYIIIPQQDGSVYIVDRRGQRRIRIKDDFTNALNSPFYVNHTNSKGVLITTDVNGHLTYIKANGDTDKTVFDDFSAGHHFLYSDLDKNGAEDFIFLDKKKLIVYDRFKEVLFEHHFKEEIQHRPEVIPVSYRQNVLAVVSSNEGKVYLFNDKGENMYHGDLAGSTAITVGSLNNDKELNLLVGSDNTLYNYLLK